MTLEPKSKSGLKPEQESYRELCRGKSWALFIESLKAEETRDRYGQRFRKFLSTVHYDTERLASLGRSSPKKLEEIIIKYIMAEKERYRANKIASGTVWENVKPIRHFCEMNDINLNWKKLNKLLPALDQKGKDRAYRKGEIAKLLDFADTRAKAIILIMATCGCRVGALPGMKVADLSPVTVESKLVCGRLVIYSGTKAEYVSFVTMECYSAIQEYIEYRKRNHESITDQSPLIRNAVRVYNVKHVEPCRPVKSRTIEDLMLRLLYKSGLRVKKDVHRYEVSTDHGFRKFFNTTCKDAKDPLHKEMLMGHSTGLEDNYYRPAEEVLLKSYLNVMPKLTIDDAEAARIENIQLKQELSEVEKLKQQMNSLTTTMNLFLHEGYELKKIEPRDKNGAVELEFTETEKLHAQHIKEDKV